MFYSSHLNSILLAIIFISEKYFPHSIHTYTEIQVSAQF